MIRQKDHKSKLVHQKYLPRCGTCQKTNRNTVVINALDQIKYLLQVVLRFLILYTV